MKNYTRAKPWTVARLIDLTLLLHSERNAETTENHRRDRLLYERVSGQFPDGEPPDPKLLFSLWLDHLRDHDAEMPGEELVHLWKTVVLMLAVVAFFVGIGFAGVVLESLEENGHVSALRFFFVTVGLQFLVLIVGLAVTVTRRLFERWFGKFRSLRVVLGRFLMRLAGAGRKSRVAIAMRGLGTEFGPFKGIFATHVAAGLSVAAIVMNLGIVASVLVYHFNIKDYRFGWSSTWNIQPQTRSIIVEAIATPWSWVLPTARPTLAQIEASRLTAERSQKAVPQDASWAWAKFLVMSIVIYGITLRLGIALVCFGLAKRNAGRVPMNTALHARLWQRMRTALPEEHPDPPKPQKPREPSWWRRLLAFFGIGKLAAAD